VVCYIGDGHLPELGDVAFWDWWAYGGLLRGCYFLNCGEYLFSYVEFKVGVTGFVFKGDY